MVFVWVLELRVSKAAQRKNDRRSASVVHLSINWTPDSAAVCRYCQKRMPHLHIRGVPSHIRQNASPVECVTRFGTMHADLERIQLHVSKCNVFTLHTIADISNAHLHILCICYRLALADYSNYCITIWHPKKKKVYVCHQADNDVDDDCDVTSFFHLCHKLTPNTSVKSHTEKSIIFIVMSMIVQIFSTWLIDLPRLLQRWPLYHPSKLKSTLRM